MNRKVIMIIAVCGLRDAENLRDVDELDIDMMGFDFIPSSSRYVNMINSMAGILPDYSEERMKANVGCRKTIHKRMARIGMFADDMPQNIITRIYNYKLDYVQLNGEERAVMVANLLRTLRPDFYPHVKIIKRIPIAASDSFKQCDDFEQLVDYFVFDAATNNAYTDLERFDWQLLSCYEGDTPFLISGGIGHGDVDKIQRIDHPLFAGVELNSQFETTMGMKDIDLLKSFIQQNGSRSLLK